MVTMVTTVAWSFRSQSLRCAENHVGLHVKCLILFSNLNQNCNVSTNLSKTLQNKISLKFVGAFSTSFMRTDWWSGERADFNRRSTGMRTNPREWHSAENVSMEGFKQINIY
jgi:hypothetical protein